MKKPTKAFVATRAAATGWVRARGRDGDRCPRWYRAALGLLSLAVAPACARGDAATHTSASGLAASGNASAATSSSASTSPQGSIARVEVPVSLERSCREICDRSRRLNCENVVKCMPNCLAMGSLTPCTDKITSLYQCLVGQPLQNWKCAADGVAAIQAGFCDKEQGETVPCMETKMR